MKNDKKEQELKKGPELKAVYNNFNEKDYKAFKQIGDNQPNKSIKINFIINFIIFLERVFKFITPTIEVCARLFVWIYIAGIIHPPFFVNIVFILWIAIPIIDILEI